MKFSDYKYQEVTDDELETARKTRLREIEQSLILVDMEIAELEQVQEDASENDQHDVTRQLRDLRLKRKYHYSRIKALTDSGSAAKAVSVKAST